MKYTIEYDIILLSGEGIPKSCVMYFEELNLDVIKSAIALEKNVTEVKIIKIIPNKPDPGLTHEEVVNLYQRSLLLATQKDIYVARSHGVFLVGENATEKSFTDITEAYKYLEEL